MRRESGKKRDRKRFALAVDGLEGRALLAAPALLGGPASLGVLNATAAADQGGGQPTRHEQARRQFSAMFSGPFTTGPGQLTDQASQTYIQGGGNSSAFLHGNIQMVSFVPKDPSQPITGTAALIVKNVTDSGNLLILDLEADPQSLDRAGRPTRFNWTVNDGSGGTFAGATGQGTAEVRYRPGGKLPSRAWGAGTAGVVFRGQIATDPAMNILRF